MKKQIKKFSLNKKTISNLTASEMNGKIGGGSKYCSYGECPRTQHGQTCNKNCGF